MIAQPNPPGLFPAKTLHRILTLELDDRRRVMMLTCELISGSAQADIALLTPSGHLVCPRRVSFVAPGPLDATTWLLEIPFDEQSAKLRRGDILRTLS
jgi:hypothetical protein